MDRSEFYELLTYDANASRLAFRIDKAKDPAERRTLALTFRDLYAGDGTTAEQILGFLAGRSEAEDLLLSGSRPLPLIS